METNENPKSKLQESKANIISIFEQAVEKENLITLSSISTFGILLSFIYGCTYQYVYYVIGFNINIFYYLEFTEIIQYAIASIYNIAMYGVAIPTFVYIFRYSYKNKKSPYFLTMSVLMILLLLILAFIIIYSLLHEESLDYSISILSLWGYQFIVLIVFVILIIYIIGANEFKVAFPYLIGVTLLFFIVVSSINAFIAQREALSVSRATEIVINLDNKKLIKSNKNFKYLGRTKNYLFFKMEKRWKRMYSLEKGIVIDFK